MLQCKRYTNSVGNKAVQEAFAAKTFARAQYAAVVTNSKFTPAAGALAASTGVLLLHFTDLARPNKLFGLPDTPSLHRPSDVTDAQISKLRQSRVKPTYIIGFCVILVLAFVHDLSQTDASTSPASVVATGGPPESAASTNLSTEVPAEADHLTQSHQSASLGSTDAKGGRAATRQAPITAAGQHPKPQPRAPLKTSIPAFLRDGNTFCAVASDFDKHWRWSLSGDQAHEPSTPSCMFVFGQLHPMRVSVLQRLSSNKTMIRVEEGDLAGRTGYTDAYLP